MKFKNTKGSIAIFVLIGLLFMASFLIISYGYNVNKSKISKDQFDTISDIYMPNNDINESYNEAYAYLRKKNKKTQTYNSNGATNLIELENTFEDKISNYKIYGNLNGLGDFEEDKYVIDIKITDTPDTNNIENYTEQTYKIILNQPLYLGDYINYLEGKIKKHDGTEEDIELPELYTYEDYTKIEILTLSMPSQIEIEYMGYKFDSVE